jgi:hypothetical protein
MYFLRGYLLLAGLLSVIGNKPRFCVNCKHFIPSNPFGNDEFGKCALYAKIEPDNTYFVTGESKYIEPDYKYCTIVRSYEKYCGKDGKHYSEKKCIWPWLNR